ncbi:hypothetical protein OG800_49665 (plasmid) [Streptomyces sp. NBC_00445]|uniref:hypothetical protein n=1 Tax=Streptomyces sp. NBC_00445 TaxID=2975745 RepID=UPI002E23358E
MRSIGTARHFQPVGTPGAICRDHKRAVLAPAVALEALRCGYGPDLTDSQLDDCARAADHGRLSGSSREAVRSALRPVLTANDSPESVHEKLFALPPGHPMRIRVGDREYFLVPIPIPDPL